MTTTNWRKAATGDFAKKGKWDDGRPGIHTDAVVAATGANYVVKVISADAAHSLTLDSINATLLEKVHGSLDVGLLDIERGTAILTTANTIGSIAMTGGELEFSNSAALGAATISLSRAILAATADAEISNDITSPLRQASFAVKSGEILKLDGGLTFNTQVATTLNFTGAGDHGKGDGTGVVDVDGTVGAMKANSTLTITGVTLGTSIADNTGFETFLSNTHSVKMLNNAVLDLTGQNNITMKLQGDTSAHVINSGPLEDLFLFSPGYGGEIRGDFDLTIEGGSGPGTIALKSGDLIHVIGACDFSYSNFEGDAPAINLEDGTSGGFLSFGNSLHGATFSGAGPAVDLGTGQNNSLYIDHTFIGTLSNFGGHNGGTDHITIVDEQGRGNPTLMYVPNEVGTGGELIVTFADTPAFNLNLEGNYTQDDFKVDPNTPNEIDCSAEKSAPHVPAHLVDALV